MNKSTDSTLSFHICSYKTQRNGVAVEIVSADDVYSHNDYSVSETVERILIENDLYVEDIISMTGDYTGLRDTGSWDFWLICRNPNGRRLTRPVAKTSESQQ